MIKNLLTKINMMSDKNKLNITINEKEIFDGARKIMKKVRPEWNKDKIIFKMLTDGITNKLVRCSVPEVDEDHHVLIRIYGNNTDLLIDRKEEISTIKLLNDANLAPRLYASFNNGLVYQYVPGTTLTPTTVKCPKIWRLIARQMARMHKVKVMSWESIPESKLPIWSKIDQLYDLVPEYYMDEEKQQRYRNFLVCRRNLPGLIETTKRFFNRFHDHLVFCHNDLLLGNVIYNEEKNSVTFIDFEYASLNYPAYDIANHFTEFAGVENVDYNHFPDKPFQMQWLQEYLDEFNQPDFVDVEKLYKDVNDFVLVTHLFWGMWALIQAENSKLDFDFLGYADIRFKQFLRIVGSSEDLTHGFSCFIDKRFSDEL